MTTEDNDLNQQINAYMEKQFERYVNWYTENAKLAKNSLIAALIVIVICGLCLVFFPGPMDQMSFFQYRFDPTTAIQLGLIASIILSIYSMHTSFKRLRLCLAINAQLQSELSLFNEGDSAGAGDVDETAFNAFKSNVDRIMAENNPEVVAAVELDNRQRGETS